MQKIPYLGWWPSERGGNLTSLWTHVEKQLPVSHKPLALPLPQAHPLQPQTPTHLIQFQTIRRPHWHIGLLLQSIQLGPSDPHYFKAITVGCKLAEATY